MNAQRLLTAACTVSLMLLLAPATAGADERAELEKRLDTIREKLERYESEGKEPPETLSEEEERLERQLDELSAPRDARTGPERERRHTVEEYQEAIRHFQTEQAEFQREMADFQRELARCQKERARRLQRGQTEFTKDLEERMGAAVEGMGRAVGRFQQLQQRWPRALQRLGGPKISSDVEAKLREMHEAELRGIHEALERCERDGVEAPEQLRNQAEDIGRALALLEGRSLEGRGRRPELPEDEVERALELLASINPPEAEELRELRREEPGEFREAMEELLGWLEEMRELREDDPEMFELEKKSRHLSRVCEKLADEAREARGEKRKNVAEELRQRVGDLLQVRLAVRKHEIQRLERELKELRGQVERMSSQSEDMINKRLERLLNEGDEW